MPINIVRQFLKTESAGGIILFIMAVLALILDNSHFAPLYQAIFQMPLIVQVGTVSVEISLHKIINDGLMAIFFLLVGLELKREFVVGELADFSRVLLPGVAAIGGMLIPAIIYVIVNIHQPDALRGWAIPVATDIAFALGVLSLFGARVSEGLKLFLMALAIFDDVGAIIIIAIFYTSTLSWAAIAGAVFTLGLLWLLNRLKVAKLSPYLILGFFLWLFVLKSGIHATVAGVLLAFMIPLHKPEKSKVTLLQQLIEFLHPRVAYLIIPLFAFANAGVSFTGISPHAFLEGVTLGTLLGLFVGKQLGVFSFAWAMVKLGWARLPKNTGWLELYGIALICGIGFTMSLFLGTLAFENGMSERMVQVRLGVLAGSLLSGTLGASFLYLGLKKQKGISR